MRAVIKCLPWEISDGPDGMKFWCPFCRSWHFHGRGSGPRVSHCQKNESPLAGGYRIQMLGKRDLRKIVKEITAYLEKNENE